MAIPLVMGDQITGQCAIHFIPNPTSGAPQPGPPMPFSAPITLGVSTTVQIGGTFVALAGSNGLNTPPHVGLHPTGDPYAMPNAQVGNVVTGSPTVTVDGKPIATTDSTVTMCQGAPGRAIPSVANVTVG
jgi:uncharacterized Zn-binding protein involved in type VI secretion